MRNSLLFVLLLPLLGPPLRALEISEVLPQNEGGLQDADLASPGWIELHNESAGPVDTAGWHLTDDPLQPAKWTLPSRLIPANGYLLVFASGKDRAPASGELHTSFQLNPGGEYLALTRPDQSVAQAFDPVPELRRNVSWTWDKAAALTTAAVREGAVVRWMVPSGEAEGSNWTRPAFNDAAWSAGPAGLGFDTAAPVARIDLKSGPSLTAIPAPAGWTGFGFTTIPETGTGPVSASVTAGTVTVKLDAVGAGLTLAARNRQGTASDSLNNAASLNNLAEDFIFAATSNYVAGTPKGMDLTVSGLAPNTAYPVTLYAYDRASVAPARAALWTDATGGASGTLTFNGSDGQLADDNALLARAITLNTVANAAGQIVLQGRAAATGNTTSHNVFLSGVSVGTASFAPLIATNTGPAMQPQPGAGLYLRAGFPLNHPEYYRTLRLRVRYDDGFAAWLNGIPIASRNAPEVLVWNTAATADHPKAAAQVFEEILIPVTPGLLAEGNNVLAVQGLTAGPGDTDFLLTPVLDLLGELPPGGVYYATPTPGAVNSTPYQGLVRDTRFSADRQYFTGTVSTAITCSTPGAEIRYTLDGSAPSASSGSLYTGPLTFQSTAILRAAAFYPGWIPSNPDTQSYLNAATIAAQPAAPAGWPATWGTNAEVNTNDGAGDGTVPANYAMDQRVTGADGYDIPAALRALPTLSIALNPGDFLGSNGIYQNPQSVGTAWERDCSLEMIDPAGAEPGFHETCRIEVHGNSSRRPYRMQKHALRLSFKGEAGAAKLRYRFFPGSELREINKLILRATFTDGWGLVSWDAPRYRPDDSTMTRDAWMRRSWAAAGNYSPKSRYVHVVINGLYWGIYDAAEHIDDESVAANLGGMPGDWEVISDFVDPDPSATSPWKNLFAAASAGLAAPAAYEAIQQWLDPANFADYYLLHQYAECEDWPHHNGGACRLKAGGKYRWLPWDQEIALQDTGSTYGHNIDRISPAAANTTTARTPGPLWHALRANPEWRLLVADRAHHLFHNGGPFSLAASQSRWLGLAGELDHAIVAESARWGDTAVETPYGNTESRPGVALKDPYMRAPDWLGTVQAVAQTWLPSLHERSNSFAIITRLKNQSPPLWPATEPPEFSPHGGVVPAGFPLPMTAATAGAVIYYTLDGSDPRTAVTGAAAGTVYTGPVPLSATGVVKARAVTGVPGSGSEVWSALTTADFIAGTPASAASLAVSEIHYNPEGASGTEFVELMNLTAGPIDLTGVQFTEGISYAFAPGTVLPAGGRLVLAGDAAGFAARFPDVAVHGVFTGKLDNDGELLVLTGMSGTVLRAFAYRDSHPWPEAADGGGHSLTLIAPLSNPDPALAASWRASVLPGGSPGQDDAVPFTGSAEGDGNGDGLNDLVNYAFAAPFAVPAVLPDGRAAVEFLRTAGADAARVMVESSPDMVHWTPLSPEQLAGVSRPSGGTVTETWTAPPGCPRCYLRARPELR